MDERRRDVADSVHAFIALLTGSLGNLDEQTLAKLAGELTTEGGPNRLPQMVGVAVGMTKELIHELAIATGRTEEEILQERVARWMA